MSGDLAKSKTWKTRLICQAPRLAFDAQKEAWATLLSDDDAIVNEAARLGE